MVGWDGGIYSLLFTSHTSTLWQTTTKGLIDRGRGSATTALVYLKLTKANLIYFYSAEDIFIVGFKRAMWGQQGRAFVLL